MTANLAIVTNVTPQLNQCTVADLNSSGEADAGKLAYLLGEWNKVNSPADLNISGRVDAWDLGFLLWGWQQPRPVRSLLHPSLRHVRRCITPDHLTSPRQ